MDAFTTAYVGAALWSTLNIDDPDGKCLDEDFEAEDIHPDTMSQIEKDCAAFQADNAADLKGIDPEQAGHDFWLTRERHGTGFWDRGLGVVGDRLTEAAHAYGGFLLYPGDDGKIHH